MFVWAAHQPDQHYHAPVYHLHPHLSWQVTHVDQFPGVLQDAADTG